MRMRARLTAYLLLVLAVFGGLACSPMQGIRTGSVQGKDIRGPVDLILYGCRYLDDPETLAIFDPSGDRITFAPYAPADNYKVIKNITSEEALKRAREFIRCSSSFHDERLAGITDETGYLLGYELRPLYFYLAYGMDDLLLVDYSLSGDTVIVRARRNPALERGRGDDLFDRRR